MRRTKSDMALIRYLMVGGFLLGVSFVAPTTQAQFRDVTPKKKEVPTAEPVVEEPAVEEPAVEEPVVEEPANEEPAIEEPAVEESEEPAPIAEEDQGPTLGAANGSEEPELPDTGAVGDGATSDISLPENIHDVSSPPVEKPDPGPPPVEKEIVEASPLETEPAEDSPPVESLEESDALSDQVEIVEPEEAAIQPLRFNRILVGETSAEELLKIWGKPFKIIRADGFDIIKYRRRPFRQVDVTVREGTVESILVHLDEPLDPVHAANEMALASYRPVPVPDEFGKVLGLSYPERGVLFSFRPDDPDSLVAKIHIEQINPEPFVLRVLYDFKRHYEMDLQDIDIALQMKPKYGQAHWAKAEILESVGRFHDALSAAEKAVEYDPKNAHFRLTMARLLAANGDHELAFRHVERVVDMEDLSQPLRALAHLELGNLIANSHTPQFKVAMKHHLKAIDLAAPVANDRRFVPRRLSKQVLIRAHLAVAKNITMGKYQRQRQVAPKWLSRARALAEESISRDQGDRALRLMVYRHILETAADLRNPDDPSRVIDDIIQEGRKLISLSDDSMNSSRLEWMLGSSLAEAVRLQRLRGAADEALSLADDALVLLQQSAVARQSTTDQKFLVGRLYFHVGSLHAVHRKDHEEAIAWYQKAEPLMKKVSVGTQMADAQSYGESFISMGVSYWQRGDKEKAISLTEFGTDVMQKAVVDGSLAESALSIAYGNLASMHHDTGNKDDARAFAELAAGLKAETKIR